MIKLSNVVHLVNIRRSFSSDTRSWAFGKILGKALNVNISYLNWTLWSFSEPIFCFRCHCKSVCAEERDKRGVPPTAALSARRRTSLLVGLFFVSSLLALSLMCFVQKHPGASAASGAALIKGWRERCAPPSPALTIAFHSFLLMSVHLHHPFLLDMHYVSGLIAPIFTLFPLPLFIDQSFLRENVGFERKNKCGGAKHMLTEVINLTTTGLFAPVMITIRTIIMFSIIVNLWKHRGMILLEFFFFSSLWTTV